MANEVIVGSDAVATAIEFLHAEFTTRALNVALGTSRQDKPRFIVVQLVDTERYSVVFQRSIVRFEVYVDEGPQSHEDAQDLAQLVRGLLGAMQGTTQTRGTVYKVEDEGAQGLSDDPDPLTGKFRYPFHVAITMRGVAV